MFDSTNEIITDCINLALAGTGWIVGTCDVTRRRTVRKTNSSSWDIIQEARKVYRCELEFDTLNKKVNIYEKRGIDKGVYFLDSLNLKDLSIQSDSYDFYTRIIAKGKDNLKVTLENFQYSNKIKTYIWKDERYTNIESLTEDAEAKLDELSKPYRAYSATIIDLANISKEDYKYILSYNLGDVITLVSKENEIKEKQRIVKMVEYPDEPDRNTCEIANTTLSFEDVQKEFQDTSDTVNNITTDNGTVDGSKINGISTEQIYDFEASVGKITDLTIVNARIDELYANKANISELNVVIANVAELNATKANITDLNTINANIQSLIAADATINNALIGKADITELNAVKGTINVLESDTANIKNLLAGNISGESGQLIHLTASNVVIADAVIKDLIAANISVKDLKTSTLSTDKFNICSDDGGISIVGSTMQFKDSSNTVQMQLGKDAQGKFTFFIKGEGNRGVLIDGTGLKENAIADDLIKSNMVATDAIGEKQINYSSLITGLNKDTNTSLIKASKVAIDLTGQSLEVSFNSLKSNVDNMEIGGRNLLKGTKDFSIGSGSGSIISETYNGFSIRYKDNSNGTGTTDVSVWYDSIPVKAESYYILSFYAKGTGSFISHFYPSTVASGYSSEGVTTTAQDGYIKHNLTSEWKRYWITWETLSNASGIKSVIPMRLQSGSIGYICGVMFEIGNKVSDWQPAIEDVDSKIESNTTAISVAQGKIEGLISENTIIKGDLTTISDKYTSLKATVDGINTTVASHTSSIGSINTSISGLSGKVTTIENKQATLEQNLNGFKTTVANNYSTKTELSGVDGKLSSLTSRVNTAESSIIQLNNKIALKVEATDITNAINNMDIGGENIFLNANFAKRYTNNSIGWDNSKNGTTFPDSWGCYNAGVENPSTGYHAHLYQKDGEWVARYVNESDKRWKAFPQKLSDYAKKQLVPGEQYTFSVDLYSENEGCFIHGGLYSYRKDGTTRGFYSGSYTLQPTTLNKWIRMSWTFTVHSDIDLSKDMEWYIYGHRGAVGTIYMKKPQLQRGTKSTDFSISQEDNDKSIANVQTQVTTTSNKVATIETNLSSITQRVSSTESTISTHTSQLSTVDSRINTAKNSAISTAASDATSKANTAQTNAINSAKSYTDIQITTVNQTITNKVAEIKATTDSITSTVSKVEQIATSSLQGKMLFVDSTFKNGFNSIGTYNNVDNGNVVVSRVTKSSDCPTTSSHMIQITTSGTATPGHGGFYFANMCRANAIFITKIIAKIPVGYGINFATNGIGTGGKYEWLTSNAGTGNWKEYIFKVTCGSTGTFSTTNYYYLNGGSAPVTWYLAMATVFDITETSNIESRMETAEQKITPTAITTTISSVITGGTGSISTTQFVMDKNGLAIKNGALTIKNKSGTTVLNSDTSGNLIITGEMRSQYGQQWVGLNAGGLTFQDSQRNEQMLRVGLAYYEANRDMNGIEFAMPQYSDFIRFSHISKADLNNGWSSSDTSYNFFELWSGTNTFGGSTRNKGMTVNAPLYVNKRIKLYSGTSHLSEVLGDVSWNNGNGTVSNMAGMYGDNGAVLGYKSGEDLKARFLVSEGAHPGTGDNIISWGNYNFNGYTFHNANIVAKSLSVSGSKNCLQETLSYGSRLINAYETAEYYFGDLGFARINEDGECLVSIDDTFLECVNTNAAYHVFTQIYNGSIKTIERYKTYFIVKGEPGTSFSWELKAKRIGYENNRLDTQEIETQGENKIELFGDEDFKVKTSENTLMDVLTFELENLLLMEG